MACQGETSTSAPPLPSADAGDAVAFARLESEPTVLELPDSSRPHAAPDRVDLVGPWKVVRTVDGVTHYETPLPIRPRALFFSKPGPGMVVRPDKGAKLAYDRSSNSKKAGTWRYDATRLILRTSDGEPDPGAYTFAYPKGTTRERALNLDTWREDNPESSDRAFVQRTLQWGEDTRTGLLLPAPATAAWQVAFPANATLQLDATVLPPELLEGGLLSDGATVVVEVTTYDGTVHEVLRQELEVGEWSRLRADVSFVEADKIATVGFRTEGGEDTQLDYVFLAEPTLYTPKSDPDTVVMVFLDTLRADHLGVYGYDKPVSPKLDAWAQDAMVFESARSVAPWTLPSTRTTLSGRQPEFWPREFGPNVAETLAAEGWATGAYVGNIYLSSNFDMSRGWSEYGCENWPLIDEQVEKAEAFLERHPDRDRLVLLHTMDMHLPYTEPGRYRGNFAGDPPAGLNAGSERRAILSAYKKDPDAVRDWVMGRYDQNIQYTDDVLTPFLESLPDDATVVIFADHGEEFWDHDDFEHGHTLYEELLHIPLIIKSPGLPAGRLTEPVSLMDVTPTIYDLADVSQPPPTTGLSLVPAASGEEKARQDLVDRPHSVGRPLYGDERWGVIAQDLKWTTYRGNEDVYDLKTDPDETTKLDVPLQPLRDAFAQGLAQDAPQAWRVDIAKAGKAPKTPQTWNFSVPGGFSEAWLGQDPLKGSKMALAKLDDGSVDVVFFPGKTGAREIYLVPGDVTAPAGLTITVSDEVADEESPPPPEVFQVPEDAVLKTGTGAVANTRVANRTVKVGLAVAPVPRDGMQLAGVDPEVQAALDAMGYSEREDEDGEEPEE